MRLSERRYLHHCSIRSEKKSEKNQRTWDKLITLMKKVCCQLSPFSHTQVRDDPNTNLVRLKNGNLVAARKTKQSGFSLKDKNEQILAEVRIEIQKHELQADSDRRSIQELTRIIESQRREIDHTLACDEQLRRDQQDLHEQLPEQNRDFREADIKQSSWDGIIEESSRVTSRWIFDKKIDRKSGHDWWTHGQNSGITEWSQLYEWLESF